jgi:hypothetical protein
MFYDAPPQITTAAHELAQEAARDRAVHAALDSADKTRSYQERSKSRDRAPALEDGPLSLEQALDNALSPAPEDGAHTPGSSLNDVDSVRFLASLDAITPRGPNVTSTSSAARGSAALTTHADDSASSVLSSESDTRVQQALQEAYDTPIHVVDLEGDDEEE